MQHPSEAARSLAPGIQEQASSRAGPPPWPIYTKKTLFSKSIKCTEEIRIEIGGGTAAKKHAVPRDSRGGSSSERASFATTHKSIREDGEVAGVELKTNRVADGPSPSPRVQFSGQS